jgi:hypothetical protein
MANSELSYSSYARRISGLFHTIAQLGPRAFFPYDRAISLSRFTGPGTSDENPDYPDRRHSKNFFAAGMRES